MCGDWNLWNFRHTSTHTDIGQHMRLYRAESCRAHAFSVVVFVVWRRCSHNVRTCAMRGYALLCCLFACAGCLFGVPFFVCEEVAVVVVVLCALCFARAQIKSVQPARCNNKTTTTTTTLQRPSRRRRRRQLQAQQTNTRIYGWGFCNSAGFSAV